MCVIASTFQAESSIRGAAWVILCLQVVLENTTGVGNKTSLAYKKTSAHTHAHCDGPLVPILATTLAALISQNWCKVPLKSTLMRGNLSFGPNFK